MTNKKSKGAYAPHGQGGNLPSDDDKPQKTERWATMMYAIYEKSTGYLITITEVNAFTRHELENCGFICRKVGAK